MARKISSKDKNIARSFLNGLLTPTEAAKEFGVKTRNDAYRIAFRSLKEINNKKISDDE